MRVRAIDRRGRVRRDERGVVLILWALLMVAMLMMVAIVLDLSSYREERRDNRRAADAAAAAGALNLGTSVTARVSSCDTAWRYAWRNLGETPPSSPCSALTVPCGALTTGVPLSATQNGRTVTILTPVPDSSDFMKANTTGADTAQAITDVDGEPCDRLGVRIAETRETFFAGLIGQESHTTNVHTVARRESSIITIPASLVVLEPKGCVAFHQTGTGNVRILAPSDPNERGGIVVVSDGSRTTNPLQCASNKPTIDAGGSGDIIVDQPGDIFLAAMTGGTCTGTACEPNDVASGSISPQPLGMPTAAPVGRYLVDHRYNCRSAYTANPSGHYQTVFEQPGGYSPPTVLHGCPDAPAASDNRDYIHTLVTYGDNALQFEDVAAGSVVAINDCGPVGQALMSNPLIYYDVQCSLPNGVVTLVGAGFRFQQNANVGTWNITGNAYFDRAVSIGNGSRLTVLGNSYFAGTVDVSNGILQLRGRPGGGFSASCAGPATNWQNWVSVATRLSCLRSSATAAGWSILTAKLSTTGSSTLDFANIAVVGRTSAQLDINGNVLWSAPTTGPLEHLAFWSDWQGIGTADAHKVTAGGALQLEGVFFAPEAEYSIRGSFPTTPQEAQFLSRLFSIAGSGEFRMLPDPEAIQIPVPGGIRLIR